MIKELTNEQLVDVIYKKINVPKHLVDQICVKFLQQETDLIGLRCKIREIQNGSSITERGPRSNIQVR